MSAEDDAPAGSWTMNPEAARALRLEQARRALAEDDPEAAIVEAEELLDSTPDDVDALEIVAVASMSLRDFLVARQAWASLAHHAPDRSAPWSQRAVCDFELCRFEDAAEAARAALGRHEELPEAWYVLGLSLDRLDEAGAGDEAFVRAHRLAPLSHPLPMRMDAEGWSELVREAVGLIPEGPRMLWDGVPAHLMPFPAREELIAQVPPITPRILALYEGDPSSDERPRAVRIYLRNLAYLESLDLARDELARALELEALDWLESPDEDVDDDGAPEA